MLFISEYSYANLTQYISGSYFESNGESFYPCAGGGEPLVIYGSMFEVITSLISKIKQEPIYLCICTFATRSLKLCNKQLTVPIGFNYPKSKSLTDAQYVKLSLQKKMELHLYQYCQLASAYVENGENM